MKSERFGIFLLSYYDITIVSIATTNNAYIVQFDYLLADQILKSFNKNTIVGIFK